MASGSADATIKLWDITTQKCVHTLTHHRREVCSPLGMVCVLQCVPVAMSHRRLFGFARFPTRFNLWRGTPQTPPCCSRDRLTRPLLCWMQHRCVRDGLGWGRSAHVAGVLTHSWLVGLWWVSPLQPKKVAKFDLPSDVESLAWNPHNPHQFVASCDNGMVLAYDYRLNAKPVFTVKAHDSAVSAVTFAYVLS